MLLSSLIPVGRSQCIGMFWPKGSYILLLSCKPYRKLQPHRHHCHQNHQQAGGGALSQHLAGAPHYSSAGIGAVWGWTLSQGVSQVPKTHCGFEVQWNFTDAAIRVFIMLTRWRPPRLVLSIIIIYRRGPICFLVLCLMTPVDDTEEPSKIQCISLQSDKEEDDLTFKLIQSIF